MAELARRGIGGRCLLHSLKKAPRCSGFETVPGSLEDIPEGSMDGVDMVVHLVGIVAEEGASTFESVHVRGTANLVNEALKAGVKRFFYQSSLGASINSPSMYQKSKARAEEAVMESGMHYTIFRPSLILGRGDGFSKQIVDSINSYPVMAVPGTGEAKFQPLTISDWVKCFLVMLEDGRYLDRVCEIGGPERFTFNELIMMYMQAMGVKKRLIHVPTGIVKTGISLLKLARAAGYKKFPPVSRDQITLLETDNITDTDSIKKGFGFEPENVGDALRGFLPSA